MRKKIILVGGGGHCSSSIDVIESTNKFKIIGIIDSHEKIGTYVSGYKIIGTDADIPKYIKSNIFFFITIGFIKDISLRNQLFNTVTEAGGKIISIVSTKCYLSKYAQIKNGTIIMHNAFVNAHVTIGKNCIINTNAIIEHDCKIGNNCHISTSAVINGDTTIGNNSFIGSNATLSNGITICDNVIIGAGSVVLNSIVEPGTYVGNPAGRMK